VTLKKNLGIRTIILFLITALFGCVEPYNPPALDEVVDLLVVDGFINASDNSAHVSLSKATALDESNAGVAETNATVTIEDDQGTSHLLNEKLNGVYTLVDEQFSFSKKYRVVIATQNGKHYYSDFIKLTNTPPIDSINWKPGIQHHGIDILVNTHDDSNTTHYYQWTFEETWEYTSNFPTAFRVLNGIVIPIEENLYHCWRSETSDEILVGSTVQLSADVIREFRLLSIPVPSLRLSHRYSLLVKQRALSKDAFDFYTQLKKSTESLGGLFDPMPAQVLGNLHSDNPNEPVLGYFSGGEIKENRIFIRFTDLPPDLLQLPRYSCPVDSIPVAEIKNTNNIILINSYGSPGIVGYTTAHDRNCMDCRDEGGVIERPDFW
jgi:hypothetical protein